MKKSIQKPVNWQDFEDLCKVLWGEIWKIPHKIKKNGRSGQSQAGVDISGIPKDEKNYFGIQCKGKDDYTNAKLTKQEVDQEIQKAKTFLPKLEVFIFATTANKDAEIEEYIRIKDVESRNNNSFEILLFCWEDIADLIDRNHDTFNYWVNKEQFTANYGFDFSFSGGLKEFTIQPQFIKEITKYKHKVEPTDIGILTLSKAHEGIHLSPTTLSLLKSEKTVNCSWCTFKISINNCGSKVLEDYKLYIYPEDNKFRGLAGYLGNAVDMITYYKYSDIHVFEDEKYAVFYSKENKPLIQKDGRSFDLHILTNHEKYEMKIRYELLARDYSQEGEITLKVDPTYEEEYKITLIDEGNEIPSNEITIKDLMTASQFLL